MKYCLFFLALFTSISSYANDSVSCTYELSNGLEEYLDSRLLQENLYNRGWTLTETNSEKSLNIEGGVSALGSEISWMPGANRSGYKSTIIVEITTDEDLEFISISKKQKRSIDYFNSHPGSREDLIESISKKAASKAMNKILKSFGECEK